MDEKMQFGTVKKTDVLEDGLSTVTTKTSYKNYEKVGVPSRYYEIRKMASNELEIVANFSGFLKELGKDVTKCDPVFRIENFGHAVKPTFTVSCYTIYENY